MVLKNTNIILSGADPEFLSADMNEAITQILTACLLYTSEWSLSRVPATEP